MPTVQPVHYQLGPARAICGEASGDMSPNIKATTCPHCLAAIAVTKITPRAAPPEVVKPILRPAKLEPITELVTLPIVEPILDQPAEEPTEPTT